jgi:hypothetical protein
MTGDHAFHDKLLEMLRHNEEVGERYIVVNAENFMRHVAGSISHSRLAQCCEAMKRNMHPGDEILEESKNKKKPGLTVCYKLPRKA